MGGTDTTLTARSMCRIFAKTGTGTAIDLPISGDVTVSSDAVGKDLKVFGGTTGNYFLWDADVNTLTLVGTAAKVKCSASGSSDGSGASLYLNAAPFRFYADTGGYALVADSRSLLVRTLIGTTQTSSQTLSGIRSQLQIKSGVNLQAGFWHAIRGYVEVAGATTLSAATICLAGLEGYLGLSGAVTIGAAAVVAAVKAITANEGSGAYTVANELTAGSGKAVAFYIAPTTINWTHGIYIPEDTCNVALQFGELGQNADGSGLSIANATHYSGEINPAGPIKIFADTDSTAIYGDNATLWVRNLIGTAQTTSATWSGIRSHLYLPASGSLTAGFWNCVRGYVEAAGALTIGAATICLSGLEGYFGLSGAVTIGAAAVVAGVKAIIANEASGSFSISNELTAGSGKAVAFYIAPSTINWSHGIYAPNDTCNVYMQFGELTQNADGTGISMKDADHYSGEINPASLIKIFADTDSTAITGDNATFWVRDLIGTTQTSSATWSAIRGHTYVPTGKNLQAGFWNAIRAYVEMAGTTSLTNTTMNLTALEGYFGLTGTVTVGANAHAAGLSLVMANEGAGAWAGTGIVSGIYARGSGLKWPYLIYGEAGSCSQLLYAAVQPTGASHLRAVDIAVAEATTQSSGYNASFIYEVTNTGAMSPTEYSAGRFNLMLDTGTKTGIYNALKAKVGTNAAPTLTSANVNGFMVSMDEIGTCGTQQCLWLEMYNTSNATTSSFIMMRAQGSAQQLAVMYLLGTNRPTYFLQTQLSGGGGFIDRGSTGGDQCIGHIAVRFDTTVGYINVYSDNS